MQPARDLSPDLAFASGVVAACLRLGDRHTVNGVREIRDQHGGYTNMVEATILDERYLVHVQGPLPESAGA